MKDVEIPRLVEKIGGSWVVKLDHTTRKQLGITKTGDSVILKGDIKNIDNPSPEEDVESYN